MIDRLASPVTSEPVSPGVLRDWLRDVPDTDASLERLISAARAHFEKSTNVIVCSQTRVAVLDGWPMAAGNDDWQSGEGSVLALAQGYVCLPQGPLISVDHIKTLGSDGVTQSTLAASSYYAEVGSRPGRINLVPGKSWPVPGVMRAGIEIQYKVGLGAQPEDVPADVVQAILQIAAHWYENRELMMDGQLGSPQQVPMGAERIIARYRISPGL